MLLAVNPNRMELLKLKRRLVYAQKGHDLLEDKLQQMVHQFIDLFKRTQQLYLKLQPEIEACFKNLLISQMLISQEHFLRYIEKFKIKMEVKIKQQVFMGIEMPLIELEVLSFSYPQDSFLEAEIAIRGWIKVLPRLLKFAQLVKSCQLLAEEIESTRRRVNALEYLLIPSINQTINYIRNKLNEQERAGLLRLLRIKEIIAKR